MGWIAISTKYAKPKVNKIKRALLKARKCPYYNHHSKWILQIQQIYLPYQNRISKYFKFPLKVNWIVKAFILFHLKHGKSVSFSSYSTLKCKLNITKRIQTILFSFYRTKCLCGCGFVVIYDIPCKDVWK